MREQQQRATSVMKMVDADPSATRSGGSAYIQYSLFWSTCTCTSLRKPSASKQCCSRRTAKSRDQLPARETRASLREYSRRYDSIPIGEPKVRRPARSVMERHQARRKNQLFHHAYWLRGLMEWHQKSSFVGTCASQSYNTTQEKPFAPPLISSSLLFVPRPPPLFLMLMPSPTSAVLTTQSFVTACSHLAPPMSVLLCAAPLPTIRQMRLNQDVGSLPLLPYSCMAASCSLWTTYGLLQHELTLWAPNLVGLLLAVYYIAEYTKVVARRRPVSNREEEEGPRPQHRSISM